MSPLGETEREIGMRLIRTAALAALAALAKKGIDEARKPHNQRKIKEFTAQARQRMAERRRS
jgi:hypothetical protein